MLVTLALLSLIVLALMTVFNSTQKAFRASLTQTDILESGRLAMGLITSDLESHDAVVRLRFNTNLQFYTGMSHRLHECDTVNFYVDSQSL